MTNRPQDPPSGWTRWLPGARILRTYDPAWLPNDIVAGLVLTTMLVPVGIAYGVWSACGVALVAVIARFLFREPLTWMMGAGIALIVGGVLMIEMLGVAH